MDFFICSDYHTLVHLGARLSIYFLRPSLCSAGGWTPAPHLFNQQEWNKASPNRNLQNISHRGYWVSGTNWFALQVHSYCATVYNESIDIIIIDGCVCDPWMKRTAKVWSFVCISENKCSLCVLIPNFGFISLYYFSGRFHSLYKKVYLRRSNSKWNLLLHLYK